MRFLGCPLDRSHGGWCLNASAVVQLAPKPAPFEDAVLAFRLGRNVECVAALHHHHSVEAAFLRTRAYVRLRRLREAEKAIRSANPRPNNLADIAQCYMLLGTVLERQGDDEGACDALTDARGYVFSIRSEALRAELAYYEAAAAWRRRDFDDAVRIATEILAQQLTPSGDSLGTPQVWHGFLFELLGLTHGIREDHDAQVGLLRRGLEVLSSLPDRDVWSEASLLNNLSSLVTELPLRAVAQEIRARAESLPWSPETDAWAYNVYRALGWSEALAGNELAAFRDLREAEALAPSVPRRIEAILDRAFLFGAIGERVSARERFDEAARYCSQVNWNETIDEDRYALLWGAELAATFDSKRASAMLRKYTAIRKPMNQSLVASTHHRRWQAYEHDAFGAVAAANGDVTKALDHLAQALKIWDGLKFEWRAAKTAATIARVSGSTIEADAACRRAAAFPQSWLARPA
ncbi:MAG: hypothetical protein ACXWNJ_12790 [Vulcanimicrobiaceae bacterium]